MQKLNVSAGKMKKFAGKWIAIKDNTIIAAGETLKEIAEFVVAKKGQEPRASAFKVPRLDEGPYYILCLNE